MCYRWTAAPRASLSTPEPLLMCGVALAIDWPAAEHVVAQMIRGVAHRGEVDDPLVSPWPGAAVCTRRLPIVDAAHGRQPMLSAGGRVLLSFNGEIYNHRELRRELEAQGVVFRTGSDTEVLANAVEAWGAAALPRLVGMFAFVALDLRTRDFLAARDPLGVKPLYLVQEGDRFLFCSEIAPLLAATETSNVLLLPGGHFLTRGVFRAFPTVFTALEQTRSHTPQELERRLEAAVRARIPEDLPFALIFSGGLDSTLVAHFARQVRPSAPGYFLGDDTAPDYRFAAAYADASGLDLRTAPLPFDGKDGDLLIDAVLQAVESFEPSTVRGGFCSYALAQAIHADGFKVALCGDGADELFAGYRWQELSYAASDEIGDVVRNQALAIMARDNLQLLDRCSMRFQIEAREPFLDQAVMELALTCAPSSLLSPRDGDLWGKAPLRAIFDLHPDVLPGCIRDRRKTPFNEGCGFDLNPRESPWTRHAEEVISDAELIAGRREFARYELTSKEELLYIRKLSARLDIDRVPHLANRLHLSVPSFLGDEKLIDYSIWHSGEAKPGV